MLISFYCLIGGLNAALDLTALEEHDIKSIVTIDIRPLPVISGYQVDACFILGGCLIWKTFNEGHFLIISFMYSSWCTVSRFARSFWKSFSLYWKWEEEGSSIGSLVRLFTHNFISMFHAINKITFNSFHGVSRSAALVISYLMRKYLITTEEALKRYIMWYFF